MRPLTIISHLERESAHTPVFEQNEIKAFLEAVPPEDLTAAGPDFRRLCLAELHAARKDGLIPGEQLAVERVAQQARALSQYGDQRRLIEAERTAVAGMADTLHRAGY